MLNDRKPLEDGYKDYPEGRLLLSDNEKVVEIQVPWGCANDRNHLKDEVIKIFKGIRWEND